MLLVQSPFQQFHDSNGAALEGGSIYVGSPYGNPETSPLQVYWDQAGTIPAAQPFKTMAGYVVRYSSPSLVYVNEADYSITIRDSRGGLIAYCPSVTSVSYNRLQQSDGASYVGYIASGAGAVAETVQSAIRALPTPFSNFGAIGDGVTDDTATILTALNSGARILEGGGKTYKINSAISTSAENITVQNATFDFSSVPDGAGVDYLLNFTGVQGAATSLTSDALATAYVLAVASTAGFVADGYAWITSTAIFESGQGVVLGQYVKIKSVDSGTQLTLQNDLLYSFTTAASANISPITPKRNIRFKSVKFIGANGGIQSALNFDKCADVEVTGCTFEYCDYVSCLISRCINFDANNCTIRYARAVGLAYGFAITNGTYNAKISNSYGEDLRHFVTVGDNDGVNLFIEVSNNHVSACHDAGIDSHAACDFMLIHGNTIEGSAFDSGQIDGIIFQGLNCVISDNIVVGIRRHAIFHQMLPDIGSGSTVITGNTIRNSGGAVGGENGINVVADPGAGGSSLAGVTIVGNTIAGEAEQGIQVYALSANISDVVIHGNVMNYDSATYGCLLRSAAGYSLANFSVVGNVFRTSGVSNMYCLGTGANVLNGVISGNTLKGGTNSVRLLETRNVVESANYCTFSTRRLLVDTGSGNVFADRSQSSITTVTNSTYVVVEQDRNLICNRAGTVTITLPPAVDWPGRELCIKTIQAQSVVSAASNVAPITDSVAGTAILPATDGAWAALVSDGANWVIMQKG